MRFISSLIAATLVVSGAAATARVLSPEARLAKAIEGRTEGAPVKCLLLSDIRNTQVIDHIGFVYETRGGVVYVNRVEAGAKSLDWSDVPIVETHNGYLCDVDIVKLADPTSGFSPRGFVNLGKFVPYRRTAKTTG